jgi:coenzyme F420-reducing hydrogenase delta subunit
MSEPFEPEIVILYCGRSLAVGNHLPEGTRKASGFKVRFVMIPCSSKIETGYLIKLIEQGADGVTVVACPIKQCQFLVGSARAEHRIKHARDLLEEAGMDAARLDIIRRHDLTSDQMMTIAEERASAVRRLGENPMKITC